MKEAKPPFDYHKYSLEKCVFPDQDLEKIARWVMNPKRMLVIIGNPGIGKSGLCWSIKKMLDEQKKHNLFQTESTFFGNLRKSIENNFDYNFEIEKMAEMPFLIYDDLGSSLGKANESDHRPWRIECLINFMDQRYYTGLPTVITSNIDPQEMAELFTPRFTSRLFSNVNLIFHYQNIPDRRRKEG